MVAPAPMLRTVQPTTAAWPENAFSGGVTLVTTRLGSGRCRVVSVCASTVTLSPSPLVPSNKLLPLSVRTMTWKLPTPSRGKVIVCTRSSEAPAASDASIEKAPRERSPPSSVVSADSQS